MLLTKAGISDNLFIGNMPATVDSSWKDMVLVDVLSLKDYGAYAKGSANPLTATGQSLLNGYTLWNLCLTKLLNHATTDTM